jgi:hypothetical protein
MLTWGEFERAEPALAEAGRALLYQFGVGLAFLSTVRRDGGPRVHPMCPILHGGGMYAFIVPSPKRDDLLRDGRYAMHCFPPADNEDAFYLTGTAEQRDEPALRAQLADVFAGERSRFGSPQPQGEEQLFEFFLERCLLTRTTGHGDPAPKHTTWQPSG